MANQEEPCIQTSTSGYKYKADKPEMQGGEKTNSPFFFKPDNEFYDRKIKWRTGPAYNFAQNLKLLLLRGVFIARTDFFSSKL